MNIKLTRRISEDILEHANCHLRAIKNPLNINAFFCKFKSKYYHNSRKEITTTAKTIILDIVKYIKDKFSRFFICKFYLGEEWGLSQDFKYTSMMYRL